MDFFLQIDTFERGLHTALGLNEMNFACGALQSKVLPTKQ